MKIAFFVSRFPYPLEKGDKLRAFQQIKHLSAKNQIDLFAITHEKIPETSIKILRQYCENIYVFKISNLLLPFIFCKALLDQQPFQSHYFYRRHIAREIQAHIQTQPYDLLYCQLIRMAPYVKQYPTPKVLDYMDALSTGVAKRVDKVPFWQRWFFKNEAKRLQRFEHLIFDYFDGHTIISTVDQQRILHPKNNTIKVIPNGIDAEYFSPGGDHTQKQATIVFTGNMSYPPNEDAAQFLCRKILPLLPESTSVTLAGASPSGKVLQLKSDQVNITGWINDIREAYQSALLFVAPMQIGTGVQNKILEAMAMKIPCVISDYTAKSLKGEDQVHYFVCHSPEEYRYTIQKLLRDKDLRDQVSYNARKLVIEKYNWQETTEQLTTLFKSLV